jgi:uncharacterized protein
MKIKPKLLQIIIPVLAVYLIIGLFLFLNQKSMIYYPNNQDFDSCIGFTDYERINHNGTRFYFKNNTNERVIVYYHGNAGSACDRSYIKSIFEKPNNSLIFVEYAGYSNDKENKPSKKLILNDVRNINNFLELHPHKELIVYGQSIGSGPASYHTSLGEVKHLILVTPFSKMTDLAQSKYRIYPAGLIVTENYDNIKYLRGFNGSALIIHGDSDRIIPSRFSKELFDSLTTSKKEYVLIQGRGHNDIWSSDVFTNAVSDYLDSLNE